MSEHTQEPLTIHGPSDGKGPYDDGGDYAIVDPDGKIIGEAIHKVDHTEFRPAEANARLWAAAPDLLAASQRLFEEVGCLSESEKHLGLRAAAEWVRVAIAKAKGEANE